MPFQEHPESAEARLQRRIEALGRDRRSGSSLIADKALAAFAVYARRGWHNGSPRLLRRLAQSLCRSHPAMAILRATAAAVAEALAGARTSHLSDRGKRVAVALRDTRQQFIDARTETAARAATELASHLPLLLLSYSGSVVTVCAAMRRQRRAVRVVVCESRPRREGTIMAGRLAAMGCRVTLIADAGVGAWVPRCGAVLLGCDGAGPRGFVNKIGSLALSVLAEDAGKPVYILVDRFRFSGAVVSSPELPRYEPRDLIPHGVPGLTVDNPYFEFVPWRTAHRLVSENGVIQPSDLPT